MDKGEVVRRAREVGVDLIFFLYCDNGGIIRGKGAHVSALERRLESGIGMAVASMALTVMDTVEPIEGMGASGEVRLAPDLDTFTVLPYAPKRAVMLADLMKLDQTPWEACPRTFLKRMVSKAGEQGLRIMASFEPEWSLAKKEGDTYAPVDESLYASSVGMAMSQVVVDDIVAALEDQGLHVEVFHPELGHGQQELSIRFADALRAADNHMLYRETVRNVAWKHGLYASLAPKPFADQAGNGCHLHISAWDASGERNLFFDPQDPNNLSRTAYNFIGGVLNHMPGLVALTAPSVNSYRRLVPSHWSSAFICYGPDNREAAIRVPSLFAGNEMASVNLELKPADSSSNPYLALGGLIASGLDGIESKMQPPEGLWIDEDPNTLSQEERDSRGIQRLPADLGEAIEALESDRYLLDQIGPLLAGSYLALRRSDRDLFADNDEAFELRHHFYKY